MIVKNNLDKSFGATGSFAGVVIFIAGVILTCFYFSGVILVLLGAFVGFTNSYTFVDYDKKRIKFSNNLFGVIQTGRWLAIDPTMKIGIKESNQIYRTYSRGNRVLDIDQKDFRLVLFDAGGKEIMPVKKARSLDLAITALETECDRLGLSKLI